MKTSDKGIAALVLHEGIVPGPYRDSVGVWTFGIGHTAAAGVPNPQMMARGMPADLDGALRSVFATFRADLAKYEAAVNKAVKVPLQQHEFDALVSFHFNTGAISRALITVHLNAKRYHLAGPAFMGWLKPAEIVPRRRLEQDLFMNGRYPTGNASVWRVDGNGKVIWNPIRTLTPAQIIEYLRPEEEPRPVPKPVTGGFWAWLSRIFA